MNDGHLGFAFICAFRKLYKGLIKPQMEDLNTMQDQNVPTILCGDHMHLIWPHFNRYYAILPLMPAIIHQSFEILKDWACFVSLSMDLLVFSHISNAGNGFCPIEFSPRLLPFLSLIKYV